MFHHTKDESADFLPNLTASFKQIDVEKPIPTKEFVTACSRVQPIFDHIGRLYSYMYANNTVCLATRYEAEHTLFLSLSLCQSFSL